MDITHSSTPPVPTQAGGGTGVGVLALVGGGKRESFVRHTPRRESRHHSHISLTALVPHAHPPLSPINESKKRVLGPLVDSGFGMHREHISHHEGMTVNSIHPISIHLIDTPYQHTLSTHPNNPHTINTHTINTPYQPTLSTHPIDTPVNPPY